MAVMKAREVRERLYGRVDPQVLVVLESLAETQVHTGRTIVELSELVNQCINALDNLANAGGVMREQLTKIRGRIDNDPDTGPTR